jgi:rhodanese-related sulfurtransferase
MGVKQINAEEANEAMGSDSGIVYLDVRTPQEFEKGHPPNAINIPVVYPNPATRQMDANTDFIKVLEAHVPKERAVIVGCQMGGRSQMAAQIMEEFGYTDISNMQGGFGGVRNPVGEIVAPGWLQMEYPVETTVDESNGYETLKTKIG